jgi:cell division protein FtsQ
MFVLVIFLFSFTVAKERMKIDEMQDYFCWVKHSFIKQETVNKLLIENKEEVSSIEKKI